jgi:hypothetical protein
VAAPPNGWKPPKSLDESFRCFRLACDLPARDCARRLHKRINGTSEPFFPYCHEGCEQGCAVVKATGYVHHGNTQKGGMSEEEFAEHLSRRNRKRSSEAKFARKVINSGTQYVDLTRPGPPCVICAGEGCDFCCE